MFGKLPIAMVESLDKMKGTMLLAMAKRMPKDAADEMARHWGYLKESPAVAVVVPAEMKTDSVEIIAKSKEKPVETNASERKSWVIPDTFKDENLYHPVFGRKILDLGYKMSYLTSVSNLTQAQIWERQRILRPDRAARIVASKVWFMIYFLNSV
jgi:hypothetical protein